MPDFLIEEPDKTVFTGDVISIRSEQGVTTFDVQNGGWNWEGPDAPDTWLTEHVLSRFDAKRVRLTIEVLGDSQEVWKNQRAAYFGPERASYIERLKQLAKESAP